MCVLGSRNICLQTGKWALWLTCGPLVIIAEPSGRRFVLADKYEPSRMYERNIANVRRWVGPVPESRPGNVADAEMCTDIKVGDLSLARDTSTATELTWWKSNQLLRMINTF